MIVASALLGALCFAAPALGLATPEPSRPEPEHHHHRRQIEDGPGAGPWEFRTPEELGLDGAALDAAEAYVNEEIAGRQCWLVVKDGFIVQERCASLLYLPSPLVVPRSPPPLRRRGYC